MQNLGTKSTQHSEGLAPDWNNFFASADQQKLLLDMDYLSHIDTPAKFNADCQRHVKEIMEARGVLNLHDSIATAREVPIQLCFQKLDEEAFIFIAEVYGTNAHNAFAPDDSNISFFTSRNILKVYHGLGFYSKFLLHTHIIILSGASKSPLCIFYQNDVMQHDNVFHQLRTQMQQLSNWLVTTEINFEGISRKATESKGLIRTFCNESDTILNEVGKRDPAKLLPAHLINVGDCSMLDLVKELDGRENIVSCFKVITTAGDQPGEVPEYTQYTVKGKSYRLDTVCVEIEDTLQQKRIAKKG